MNWQNKSKCRDFSLECPRGVRVGSEIRCTLLMGFWLWVQVLMSSEIELSCTTKRAICIRDSCILSNCHVHSGFLQSPVHRYGVAFEFLQRLRYSSWIIVMENCKTITYFIEDYERDVMSLLRGIWRSENRTSRNCSVAQGKLKFLHTHTQIPNRTKQTNRSMHHATSIDRSKISFIFFPRRSLINHQVPE